MSCFNKGIELLNCFFMRIYANLASIKDTFYEIKLYRIMKFFFYVTDIINFAEAVKIEDYIIT